MKRAERMTKDLLKLKLCQSIKQQELRCANCFLKSQWENEETASTEYLIYRVWHALAVIVILILSLLEVGKPFMSTSHYFKWPIYLTNWGLMINVAQAILSVSLVYQAYANKKQDDDEPSPAPRMDTIYNLYWCMHSCSVTIAFGVSAMYWIFIYNPEFYELDIPNFASHLFNSVIMGIDFIIAGHPFELVHAIYPLLFVSAYVVFNFFYYISGGLSRKGTVTLYEAMDWRNPVSCLKFVGGGYVVVTSVHLFLCIAYAVKRRVAVSLKWRQYKRENRQVPAQDNTIV